VTERIVCTPGVVRDAGQSSNEKDVLDSSYDGLKMSEREHKLGCDETHGHPDCWCITEPVFQYRCRNCHKLHRHASAPIFVKREFEAGRPLPKRYETTYFCNRHCEKAWEERLKQESTTSLDTWEKTAEKMTEDMRTRLDNLVHDIERCLKFGGCRIWLGLQAKTMLAYTLYGVSCHRESPDLSTGRRDAIEATKKKYENDID